MFKDNKFSASLGSSKSVKFFAVATVALATVGVAAGCSSSTNTTPSNTPTSSASASPSSSTMNPVRPPIIISKAGEVTAVVGDTLDVTTPDALVATDNPAVLKVAQGSATPSTAGGATFNASATVIGVGTAKLTVTPTLPGGGAPYVVNVTATSSSASPSATMSPVRAPIIVDKAQTLAVTVGDSLDVTTPEATVTTDNPAVLKVKQPSVSGTAKFNGGAEVVGQGKATMTVTSKAYGANTYTVTVVSSGVALP